MATLNKYMHSFMDFLIPAEKDLEGCAADEGCGTDYTNNIGLSLTLSIMAILIFIFLTFLFLSLARLASSAEAYILWLIPFMFWYAGKVIHRDVKKNYNNS